MLYLRAASYEIYLRAHRAFKSLARVHAAVPEIPRGAAVCMTHHPVSQSRKICPVSVALLLQLNSIGKVESMSC
jgi:hypothetical protein